jgi:phosphohistidine phosphatase SixA
MRHSFAGAPIGKEKNTPTDLARGLEPEGVEMAHALAEYLLQKDMVPNAIRHSPVKRAKQTAKILGDMFGMTPIEDQNLEMTKPIAMPIKALAADKMQKRILVISHSEAIAKALRALNFLDEYDVDPIATCELRILDVKRKDGSWTELDRIMPSDLGGTDFY